MRPHCLETFPFCMNLAFFILQKSENYKKSRPENFFKINKITCNTGLDKYGSYAKEDPYFIPYW
jgi:hypothetical protein